MAENDPNQQLESLLEQALERSSEEREAFLQEACGDNVSLLNQLKRLLAREADVASFMNDPTVAGEEEESGEDDPIIGTEVGPYKVLQRLGEGGYGIVYLAEQRQPVNRRVALKVIKLGMDTKQVIARFEAERQALAMMEHPNIAKVLDAGATESGRPYFAMELVRGVPVTQYCRQQALDAEDRLKLFARICRAVHHAHQKGVIHRDLKPNNILVTLHDGVPVPKVIDFGIAKATNIRLTEKTLFTEFRQFVGTPAYTSPEQVEMSGLDVDTRSDIYSLGVLLYELLTGTTPIELETLKKAAYAEIQRTIIETVPPKPSTRLTELRKRSPTHSDRRIPHTDLKRELDWITMKALEKDRRRRYESASAFSDDVERFLNREPVAAAAPNMVYHLIKMTQRHRTAALAGMAILASLIAGLIIAMISRSREAHARAEVEIRERRLLDTNYAHDMQAVSEAFARGHAALAEKILQRHVPKGDEPDRREWLWRYWMGQIHRETASASFESGAALVISPDGQTLVRVGRNETKILSLPNLQLVKTIAVRGGRPLGGFFSPDGLQFFVNNTERTVIDLESYKVSQNLSGFVLEKGAHLFPTPNQKWLIKAQQVPVEGERPMALQLTCFDAVSGDLTSTLSDPITPPERFFIDREIRVSPNSRWITMSAGDRSLRLISIPDMKEVARLPLQDQANSVAWSPDSTKLAIGYDYPQDVEIWDIPSGQHTRTLTSGYLGPKVYLAFSPNGRLLAASHFDGGILIWNTQTGKSVDQFLTNPAGDLTFISNTEFVTANHRDVRLWEISHPGRRSDLRRLSETHDLWNLAYSSDGAFLATTAGDGTVRLFDALSGDLVHAFRSRQTPGAHRPPYGGAPIVFAPDDRTLVASNADHTVSVFDVVTREERFLLNKHTGAIANLTISSDGALLATTGEDRAMAIWDLVTGVEREFFPFPGPKWIDFSPQPGSHLLAFRDRDGFGLIDLDTRDRHHYESSAELWLVKFTPDGKQLIVGINGAESWLFDTNTFKRVGSLPPVIGSGTPDYTPDGRNLVMPSWGHGAQLWHMGLGMSLGPAPLPDALDWVYSAKFSPDGKTLAVSTRGYGIHLLSAPDSDEF